MSRDSRLLRALRSGSAVGGAGLLLLAMTVWESAARPRDVAWTLGVALLVLALVANRLLARIERAAGEESGRAEKSD